MTKPLIFLDPFPRNEAMVFTPDAEAALRCMGEVVTHFGSRAPDALVEEILPRVAVIIGQTAMPRERLDRAPNLRAILNVKANWEPNIDYDEAHARGIRVLSAAPAMAPAVAEFALGQAIALLRGLHTADTRFRSGDVAMGIGGNSAARSLYGAEVALVGYGNLGRALAPLLKPFGVRLLAHDPWLSDGYMLAEGLEPVSLEHALSGSDVIFLLAGVTTQNEGGLDRARLETIRSDASVILASRAEIVEFDAFLDLAAKGAFRAAVDVYPEEPVPADSAWRKVPNVLFSHHLAGGIGPSYGRIRDMMLDDVAQVLKGLPPLRMQRAEPRLAALMRSR
jgi:phosphoglycerate dehydrogenase-like enzyme